MTKKIRKNIVTTLFADIEDSTGISNYLQKDTYENFLSEFHKTIKKVLSDERWKLIKEGKYHKFMGDEFIAFFPHNEFTKNNQNVFETVLLFAATLKYEWYFSTFNRGRYNQDKEPNELNIGVNTGDLSEMEHPFREEEKKSYEGFPVTLAKRIQSIAEESASRIIVGDSFYREYTSKTPKTYEFHYKGKRTFKGIAQRFSCYEWIGTQLHKFMMFEKSEKIESYLQGLYKKNPHNPWLSGLLANYLFSLAEDKYRDYYAWVRKSEHGKDYDEEKAEKKFQIEVKPFYDKCAKICIDAIYNIPAYNLRDLNDILFDCLEVGENWDELSFRTEQAFKSDQSFSGALALRAKALFMRGEEFAKLACDDANKLIILFEQTDNHEGLFHGHFTLARYYSKEFKKATLSDQKKYKSKVIEHLRAAVRHAEKGAFDWAYNEYDDLDEKEFEEISKETEFKRAITQLRNLTKTVRK